VINPGKSGIKGLEMPLKSARGIEVKRGVVFLDQSAHGDILRVQLTVLVFKVIHFCSLIFSGS
jgi:hypothetical protein